jgi:hypothetical protein
MPRCATSSSPCWRRYPRGAESAVRKPDTHFRDLADGVRKAFNVGKAPSLFSGKGGKQWPREK